MLKVIISFLFFIFLFKPVDVLAADEFSSSYDIKYDLNNEGIATVTQEITLKNLTDRMYAAGFTINLNANEITDVAAFDRSGVLKAETFKEGDKTKIRVIFNDQQAGRDKEFRWNLQFKSKDFADILGEVKQVSIPKFSVSKDLGEVSLQVSTPVAWGDPTSISPEPKLQDETGGKLNFNFNKEQITKSGILASFGREQQFNLKLKYALKNNSILPQIMSISLPASSVYQETLIDSVSPLPENVVIDDEGNYLLYFKVDARGVQNIDVDLTSQIKYKNNIQIQEENLSGYLSPEKFWEGDNVLVKARLKDIVKGKGNVEKAREINNFVANLLEFDKERLENKNFERLGAVTILNNPQSALSLEYSDLLVAMSRAANIPAREVIGYAHTSNKSLRPLSVNGNLHSWVEIFDPVSGWIMADPTWQSTTGGADYFGKFDLTHIPLAIIGKNSRLPNLPFQIQANITDKDFLPTRNLQLEIEAPREIFASIPSNGKVIVTNLGNAIMPESQLSISTTKLNISGHRTINLEEIPPFGKKEYKFNLSTLNPWESVDDTIKVTVNSEVLPEGEVRSDRPILVKPFFTSSSLPIILISFFTLIIAFYVSILFVHLKINKKSHKK